MLTDNLLHMKEQRIHILQCFWLTGLIRGLTLGQQFFLHTVQPPDFPESNRQSGQARNSIGNSSCVQNTINP